jgi:hypothetical protein
VDRIVQQAAHGVSHIIELGSLVMFSTDTGDAWLLEPAGGVAVMLAEAGERLPARIYESGTTFAVEWTHSYGVSDDTFMVSERESGKTRTYLDYQPALLARIGLARDAGSGF